MSQGALQVKKHAFEQMLGAAVPVHGDTMLKPAVGLSMMFFVEKNRYVLSDTVDAGSVDGESVLLLRLQISMRMPGSVEMLARIMH